MSAYLQNGDTGTSADSTLSGGRRDDNSCDEQCLVRRTGDAARCRSPRFDLLIRDEAVAVDCEGITLDAEVGRQKKGLASVSICNRSRQIVYDTFVYYPSGTPFHLPPRHLNLGVHYCDLEPENRAQPIAKVLEDVQQIFDMAGVIVGHAITNDIDMLRGLSWERWDVRDTQRLPEWHKHAKDGRHPSLKSLAQEVLGLEIQKTTHSSAIDALTTMELYLTREGEFEVLAGP